MKLLGRLLLLVAGIILLVSAIPTIISTIKQINELGWNDFTTIPKKAELLVKLVLQGIYIPFAISALFGAIRGKLSFKLFIYALILIAAIVFYVVTANKAGNLGNADNVWQLIVGFSTPLMYIFGTLFLTFGKK